MEKSLAATHIYGILGIVQILGGKIMLAFDVKHSRKNTRSVKWDSLQAIFQTEDVLPMWVADMDFQAPQAVNDALKNRIEHGIYGYTVIDDDVKNAVIQWQQNRNNWNISSDWLSFSPGVVTSLHLAVKAFTKPGDNVLIQTPVYSPFYQVIESQGCHIVKNPLVREGDRFTIDFDDLEAKFKAGVKAFILCSPHNPVGRVWTKDELTRMAQLCLQYDVLIISDEIHADLVYSGNHHTPIASISKEISNQTITCMSPTKTFNLAGLQVSYIITENPALRSKIDAELTRVGLNSLNTMGNIALEAAYTRGEAWLEELLQTLNENYQYVVDTLHRHAPALRVIQAEGTYLVWIDCSALGLEAEALKQFMTEKAKVGLNAGIAYGEDGAQYMRMNIACPKETVAEGVQRIVDALQSHPV